MKKPGTNSQKQWVKKQLRDLYWRYRGKAICNPASPIQANSYLFLCKGNICRSPFAEYVSKKLDGERSFASAGLDVTRSVPPPDPAIRAGKLFGIDMHEHRATPLKPQMASEADMIIVMEARHFEILRSRFPQYREKIFLLPLFSASNPRLGSFLKYNIPDPFGQNEDAFYRCYRRILQSVENLLELPRAHQTEENLMHVSENSPNQS